MKSNISKKLAVLIAVEIISIVVLFFFFVSVQTNLSAQAYEDELTEALSGLSDTVSDAAKDYEEAVSSYDDVYTAKAASLAYMAENLPDFSYGSMESYRELLNVTGLYILSSDGEVLAAAGQAPADFTASRYNQLLESFASDGTGEPFTVEANGVSLRYYACKIDSDRIAAVAEETSGLDEIQNDNYSWESILKYNTIGKDGFTFAVSDQDHTFLYYPDDSVDGLDSLEAGIEASFLAGDKAGWIKISGVQYYACVIHAPEQNAYIVSAVPRSEIFSTGYITVGIVLFAFIAVITLVITYGIFLLLEKRAREAEENEKNEADAGKEADADQVPNQQSFFDAAEGAEGGAKKAPAFDKKIAKKLGVVCVVGLIVIGIVSWYMQCLFTLSRSSLNNEAYISDIREELENTEEKEEALANEYEVRCLEKVKTAAYILVHAPELIDNKDLAELKEALDVECIYVFNTEGTSVANSAGYSAFTLSSTEGDQSYDFWKMLNGTLYYIQDAQPDEVSGTYTQYSAYSMIDEDGVSSGFVQIATNPEKLETMIDNASIESVLRNVTAGGTGFAFAVEAETGTVDYYPDENKINLAASELGVGENALKDGFNGYLTLDSVGYYCSAAKCGDYYVFTAIPRSDIGTETPMIVILTMAASFIALLIVFFILAFDRTGEKKNAGAAAKAALSGAPRPEEGVKEDGGYSEDMAGGLAGADMPGEEKEDGDDIKDAGDKDRHNISVELPGGRKIRTQSILSRWGYGNISWKEKTPEQRMAGIMQGFLVALAVLVCLMLLFSDSLLDESSSFMYIIRGKWEHEFNIFSVTACLMIMCVVYVLTMLVRKLLKFAANVLSARGETVCRLLSSLIKYASVIAVLYYCLALFGVDTAALLASAGILALVVGLGAQSLIQDIIAGLFIIFEGEFRVGDIVTIDGFRGTVLEIGIRNTKIQDGNNNVKVISNRNVSGVLNMTKKYSIAICDVGIGYGESLERVESVMSGELANIKAHLPEIQNGPFYKGVISLGDSSVVIRLLAECKEKDRIQLERSMAREMKLILDKYDIEIPFPQIVVNQPVEKKEASYMEKIKAEAFKKEQEELSEGLDQSSSGS